MNKSTTQFLTCVTFTKYPVVALLWHWWEYGPISTVDAAIVQWSSGIELCHNWEKLELVLARWCHEKTKQNRKWTMWKWINIFQIQKRKYFHFNSRKAVFIDKDAVTKVYYYYRYRIYIGGLGQLDSESFDIHVEYILHEWSWLQTPASGSMYFNWQKTGQGWGTRLHIANDYWLWV